MSNRKLYVGSATEDDLGKLPYDELVTFALEAQKLAAYDDLTGLMLRRFLRESVSRELRRSEHAGSKGGAVLMVDIDHFKKVNDTLGHNVGDEVLVAIAEVFARVLRPGDIASRHGGEEFRIWLPSVGKQEARLVADRVREAIEKNTSGTLPMVTVSIGVALVEDHGYDLEHLTVVADKGLYVSKDTGRNKVTITDKKTAEIERRGTMNDPRSEERRGNDRRKS